MAYIILYLDKSSLHPFFINCNTSHSMESDVVDGAVLGEDSVSLWPFTYQKKTIEFHQDPLYGLY